MTAALNDKSLIKDTVAIKSPITKIEQHLLKYFMSDIIEIVVPDSDDPMSVTTLNLFENHYGVTPKMVATSNQWKCSPYTCSSLYRHKSVYYFDYDI